MASSTRLYIRLNIINYFLYFDYFPYGIRKHHCDSLVSGRKFILPELEIVNILFQYVTQRRRYFLDELQFPTDIHCSQFYRLICIRQVIYLYRIIYLYRTNVSFEQPCTLHCLLLRRSSTIKQQRIYSSILSCHLTRQIQDHRRKLIARHSKTFSISNIFAICEIFFILSILTRTYPRIFMY